MNTRQFLIRSVDRLVQSADSGNCVLSMNCPIPAGVYQCVSAIIPNTQYCVNSTNNLILFSDNTGSTVLTATLSTGNYTSSTLPSAVITALTGAFGTGAPYTCSYTGTSGCLTIGSSGAIRYRFASSTGNTCENILGFQPNTDTSASTGYTLPNSIQLQPSGGFLVSILEASSRISVSNNNGDGGCLYFPINGSFGSYNIYSSGTYYPQFLRFNIDTKVLTVQIRDSNNRLVPFGGAGWEFLLQRMGE